MGLLRLVLAFSVVAVHAHIHPTPFGGALAVRFFFAISGFYMALVLSTKYPPDAAGTRGFYSLRLLRLFPTYFVCLTIALVIALFSQGGGYYQGFFERYRTFGTPLVVLALLSQAFIVGQDVLLFIGRNANGSTFLTRNLWDQPPAEQAFRLTLLPPAWSLSLEVVFYALAPWLTRWRTSWLIGIVVACHALRFAAARYVQTGDDPWIYRFLPFEIGTFLFGVLGYRIYETGKFSRIPDKVKPLVPAVGILTLWALRNAPNSVLFEPLLLIAALPLFFACSSKNTWDRAIGEISYPLYLVHYPILALFAAHQVPHGEWIATLVSLAVSLAIVRWVDVPVESLRRRLALRLIR